MRSPLQKTIRRRGPVRGPGVVVFLSCFVLFASSASAAVTFQTNGGVPTINFPSPGTVTHTLGVTAGADTERFQIRVDSPTFGAGEALEGATLGTAGQPSVSGAATIIGAGGIVNDFSCSTIEVGVMHGFEGVVTRFVDLELPPFGVASVTQNFNISSTPPWPGLSYSPIFTATSRLSNGTVGTIGPDQVIRPPEPSLAGQSGVRIDLATKPATSVRADRLPVPSIKRKRPIRFSGSTSPQVVRQKIRLAYRWLGGTRDQANLVKIATVRTDKKGGFRYPPKASKKKRSKNRGWLPTRLGRYEVRAYYDSQQSNLASDFICPRGFSLVK